MSADELAPQQGMSAVTGKTFGIRALAYIIDGIFTGLGTFGLAILIGIVLAILYAIAGESIPENTESNQCLGLILGIVSSILFGTVFEGLFGATPGKAILGMRVVKEDGSPCDLRAALVRGIYRMIDGILFGVVAYATMKAPLYQRHGDRAAKTIVVAADNPIIREKRSWWGFVAAAVIYGVVDTIVVLISMADSLL